MLVAGGEAVGWLSLDRSVNDLGTVFFYIASSIREVVPEFGTEFLAFLESSRDPTVERVATAFVNELTDANQQIYLFLDDMHLLTDRMTIKAIEDVLYNSPANFHLVLASRKSPPFSVARLRMLGQIDEFDGKQLKFNAEDIENFVRLSGREPLSEEVIQQLLTVTEGWPAGIQLATISLAQHDDVEDFLSRFSGETKEVSEYLLEDVISRLPDSTVQFILQTSILEMFNEDLCNFVTGRTESGKEIKNLVAQSLFIFSLDDDQRWYRYHHLFSSLLQRTLRDTASVAIPDLHRKASDWYFRHNYVDLAFAHATRAQDWYGAARILDASCNNLFYTGKLSSLIKWSNEIPAEVRSEFPRLQLEIAWSIILEWRFDDALKIIRGVEDKIADWKAQARDVEEVEAVSRIVLHRKMMLALFSDEMPTVEKYVLELLHDFPSEDPYLRGTLENCLIYARREMFKLDNVDKMDRWARDFFQRSGSKFVMVWHESILGPTYHLRGDTDLAERVLSSAVDIAEYVDGPATPLQAMPAMLLAEIKYEKNEIREAEALLERLGDQADKQGFVDHLAAYYVTRARILQRLGQNESAERVIGEGRTLAEYRGFKRLVQRLDYELAHLAARSGDLAVLRETLVRASNPATKRRLSPGQHSISSDEQLVLTWQFACRQLGEARIAIEILKRWCSFAADRGAVRSEVRFLIALAQCFLAVGEEGEALRKMRAAVQKAAKPRFIRSFVDEGEVVLGLLRRLFGDENEPKDAVDEFGKELIKAFSAESSNPIALEAPTETRPAQDAEHTPPDSLNERERNVLRLVAIGMSNKEIARKLGMTEGTVKWYLQQVFLKMDVRRRSMAVHRARQFGIL